METAGRQNEEGTHKNKVCKDAMDKETKAIKRATRKITLQSLIKKWAAKKKKFEAKHLKILHDKR